MRFSRQSVGLLRRQRLRAEAVNTGLDIVRLKIEKEGAEGVEDSGVEARVAAQGWVGRWEAYVAWN